MISALLISVFAAAYTPGTTANLASPFCQKTCAPYVNAPNQGHAQCLSQCKAWEDKQGKVQLPINSANSAYNMCLSNCVVFVDQPGPELRQCVAQCRYYQNRR